MSPSKVPADLRAVVDSLTPRAERVLLASAKEASQLGVDYVGTEHLLLGLLDEPDGIACRVLLELGVDEAARTRVLEMVRSAPYAQPSSDPLK